ncbi:hypothetical protein KP509_14G060000 [Ceratopteris richardii]|uniref:non-specific serine/threonine protein kinase n=1 Tax=Ceratopteris richardii TaxID=49495 RepID=A0A8T2T8F2_CERRI|nr:hypothetical protein KP509_14G060000 [Ceratopteris richardii]
MVPSAIHVGYCSGRDQSRSKMATRMEHVNNVFVARPFKCRVGCVHVLCGALDVGGTFNPNVAVGEKESHKASGQEHEIENVRKRRINPHRHCSMRTHGRTASSNARILQLSSQDSIIACPMRDHKSSNSSSSKGINAREFSVHSKKTARDGQDVKSDHVSTVSGESNRRRFTLKDAFNSPDKRNLDDVHVGVQKDADMDAKVSCMAIHGSNQRWEPTIIMSNNEHIGRGSRMETIATPTGENPLLDDTDGSNNGTVAHRRCYYACTNDARNDFARSETSINGSSSVSFHSILKPHKAHEAAWIAIQNARHYTGHTLSMAHFKLIRRIGYGDMGSVFLAHLKETVVAYPLDKYFLFAIKIMHKEGVNHRNKLRRIRTEVEILQSVDHPFLPTLYAQFASDNCSCLVMDYCPGGSLYNLQQNQPGKIFEIAAARFYACEVLLALEYLHMIGIVYRDLKPENVLLRQDGHIMLTDFDLSLKCKAKPKSLSNSISYMSPSSSFHMYSSLTSPGESNKLKRFHSQSSGRCTSTTVSTSLITQHDSSNCTASMMACNIDPTLTYAPLHKDSNIMTEYWSQMQREFMSLTITNCPRKGTAILTARDHSPSDDEYIKNQPPIQRREVDIAKHLGRSFTSKVLKKRSLRKAFLEHVKDHRFHFGISEKAPSKCTASNPSLFLERIAEPVQARSKSFVGTHEYLAPEIIAGQGHGSPVDWWTFGIFLYELLLGRSPFKGVNNNHTLMNIINEEVMFPDGVHNDEGFADARSLIQGLLVKDPTKRLGCMKGANEIKGHAFFKDVNWGLIRCTKPPFTPCSRDAVLTFPLYNEVQASNCTESSMFMNEYSDIF